MYLKYFLVFVVFLFIGDVSFAQIDSTSLSPEEEIDTIIIKKADYIIRKEVYIDEPGGYTRYLSVYGAPVYYFSYYDVCDDCKEFLDNQKKASDPILSYKIGLNLSFAKGRIYITPGVSYTSIRERFKAIDTDKHHNLVNHYNYLDIALAAGYKFGNDKLSCIAQGYFVGSRLLNADGKIFSVSDFTSVLPVTSEKFNTYVYSLGLGFRFGFELTERLQLVAEPGYRGNISTVTKNRTPYVQQRNLLSVEVGASYAF
jgi:hypothetical protein